MAWTARNVGPVRRLTISTFGGLPGQFWFQWVGTLLNRLGTFVVPFLVLYLTSERGLSSATAGVVLAGYGAGALISQVFGGWLADRFGRRSTMIIGMLSSAMALMALGAATSIWLIAATASLLGLVGDIYRPASSALVADVVPPADRMRAYGLLFWAINLGFAVAAVAGGWLAERGYWLLFALDAATCAAFAVAIAVGVPKGRPPATPDAGRPKVGFRTALHDRLLLTVMGLTLVYATVYGQAYVTVPLAVRDAGLSTSDYGLVIACNGILIVLLAPVASGWLPRFPMTRVLAGSALLAGLGFASTGLARSVPEFAATVAVWTLGEIGMAGIGPTIVAALAPEAARGRYQGLSGTAWGASAMTAPVVGTAVYGLVGPAALWTGCLVAAAAVSGIYLAMRPSFARRSVDPGPGGSV